MTKETYRYRVTHPDLGTAEVTGADKLHAIHAAAKKWGVPWTGIARACTYERLGPVKRETKRRTAAREEGEDRRDEF